MPAQTVGRIGGSQFASKKAAAASASHPTQKKKESSAVNVQNNIQANTQTVTFVETPAIPLFHPIFPMVPLQPTVIVDPGWIAAVMFVQVMWWIVWQRKN